MALSFTVSYTFSPSTTISSAQVNQNTTDVANVFNGLEARTKTFSNFLVDTELRTGGSLLTANGTLALPSLSFTNSTDSGIYRIGASNLGFVTNATLAFDINSSSVTTFAKSIVFNPTTAGITGTLTNNSAAAGIVGEVISASLAQGSATSLTTGTAKTITSISLTPGQWSITALAAFEGGAGTVLSTYVTSISLTDNTTGGGLAVPTAAGEVRLEDDTDHTDAGLYEFPAQSLVSVAKVASTVSYYLVLLGNFSVSTLKGYGSLFATRIR